MATRDRDTDEAMSDKELIDEVLTLIVAGHETTAAALTHSRMITRTEPNPADSASMIANTNVASVHAPSSVPAGL